MTGESQGKHLGQGTRIDRVFADERHGDAVLARRSVVDGQALVLIPAELFPEQAQGVVYLVEAPWPRVRGGVIVPL